MTSLADTASAALAAPRRRLRTPNDSLLKWLCLAPVAVWFAVLFALPLLFLFWIGFWRVENYQSVPDFSLDNYRDIFANFFVRSRYGLALIQSLWVAATTSVVAVAFAYCIALTLSFAVPARWQRLALLFTVAPFWSSYVLRLYSWQTILSKNGVVNSVLKAVGLDALQLDIIYTQAATRVGLVHYLTPILVVILYVTLSNIDRTLIEAARELGATRWQAFRRVILPLSTVGLLTAASFALIIGLGDVLSGNLLGGGTGASLIGKYPLYSNMLMTDYSSATNLPRSSALATILIVVMVLVLVVGIGLAERARRRISA